MFNGRFSTEGIIGACPCLCPGISQREGEEPNLTATQLTGKIIQSP